jgi:hypothetical protein
LEAGPGGEIGEADLDEVASAVRGLARQVAATTQGVA